MAKIELYPLLSNYQVLDCNTSSHSNIHKSHITANMNLPQRYYDNINRIMYYFIYSVFMCV